MHVILFPLPIRFVCRALKIWGQHLDHTHVISLLQPPPEVFNLFDEIILMSEGQVIYHSMRVEVLNYFEGIGYTCPSNVDVADFLQELPTREGKRFIRDDLASSPKVPRGTDALVSAWKCSLLYGKMTKEIEFTEALDKG